MTEVEEVNEKDLIKEEGTSDLRGKLVVCESEDLINVVQSISSSGIFSDGDLGNEKEANSMIIESDESSPLTSIRFQVLGTKLVENKKEKYIEYIIHLKETFSSFPLSNQPKIIKRFSQLYNLHNELKRTFPQIFKTIPFPSKKLIGNFSDQTLDKRSKGFEKYLTSIFKISEIRLSGIFIKFLYGEDLLEGFRLIQNGLYEKAFTIFLSILPLQRKIFSGKCFECVASTSCLIICYKNLSKSNLALQTADLALQLFPPEEEYSQKFSYSIVLTWLNILLRTNLDLCRELGKEKHVIEEKLQNLNLSSLSPHSNMSLFDFIFQHKEIITQISSGRCFYFEK